MSYAEYIAPVFASVLAEIEALHLIDCDCERCENRDAIRTVLFA